MQDQHLTEKDIQKRYQISHSTLWRWERDGHFPKGELIGPNTKRWSLSTLLQWEKKISQSNEEAA